MKLIANGEKQEPVWRYEPRAPEAPIHSWYLNLDRASRFGWWLDITVPFWLPVIVLAAVGAVPCIHWQARFSLRTLLIATTLVAIVLGLVVAFR